ncbi:MAG: hypothetical protein EOM80_15520 [Erysipelotrichia bacterium]|nr:hypothetical protein [Erysipelotrichia bacterium]
MKRNFSKVLCMLLVCSFIFSFLPQAMAGNYNHNSLVNGIYSDLSTACNIVSCGRVYYEIQNARPYLKHAQRLLKKNGVLRCFSNKLDREIDDAKMEILWNNRQNAINHINLAMRIVESANTNECSRSSQNTRTSYRRSATGALIAAPVAVGLGTILVRFFRGFNWGQVSGTSTRIGRPNLPGSIVPVP